MELWCLPYAGASATFYRRWEQRMGEAVRIRPLELPGRGVKFGEPLLRSMEALVDYAYEQIRNATDYALFGHSLGGEIAFRLAQRMEAQAGVQPRALILSGLLPPSEPRSYTIDHRLPDAAFVKALERLGGMAPEVVSHPEMLKHMLPIVRADLEAYNGAAQTRLQSAAQAVRCRMTVLFGREDPLTDGNMERWGECTQGECQLEAFEGGHFFIHDEQAEVEKTILSILALATKENTV